MAPGRAAAEGEGLTMMTDEDGRIGDGQSPQSEPDRSRPSDGDADLRAWLAFLSDDAKASVVSAALQAAERVREAAGLVIVPREPTPEMMEAGGDVEVPACDYNVSIGSESARDAWRAMVKAAPAVDREKIS